MSEFTVFIIDDDESVLRALSRLIRSAGHVVRGYTSAQQFLDRYDPDLPSCIVSDVAMPDLDGLELQSALASRGGSCPIIFLSGRSNIPISVRAIKAGAVDFLTKPVDDEELLAAIGRARQSDVLLRARRQQQTDYAAKVARLTPRERQVMGHVAAGRLNKQIAASLGIVEKTIKVHRARMMQKMEVHTVADLVRLI